MLSRLIRIQRLAGLAKLRSNFALPTRSISTTPAVFRRDSHFRYVGTEPDNFDEVESVWFIYYAVLWMGVVGALCIGYHEYNTSRIGERYANVPLLRFDNETNEKKE